MNFFCFMTFMKINLSALGKTRAAENMMIAVGSGKPPHVSAVASFHQHAPKITPTKSREKSVKQNPIWSIKCTFSMHELELTISLLPSNYRSNIPCQQNSVTTHRHERMRAHLRQSKELILFCRGEHKNPSRDQRRKKFNAA